jgi:imidazolonepropionase-like amidohydrolase
VSAAPSAEGAGVLIVAADPLIDGTGRPPLQRGGVAVDGERIVAVDTLDALTSRFPGARPEHFAGGTLLPGFVDSHVHTTFSAGAVPLEDLQADGDVVVRLRGAINARDALQAGVTTMRDLGGRDRWTPARCRGRPTRSPSGRPTA